MRKIVGPANSNSLPVHQSPGQFAPGDCGPQLWGAVGLNLLVIWTLCAELPPGINESHYLPKARHAWDPSFAPGDLFLSSGNAHWLFAQLAGWMSSWLPLTAVAWVGRLGCWSLMAWAWAHCARGLRCPPVQAACVLASWILATRLGNWAGEWAIGGFEGKSIAYPLVIMALAAMLEQRWERVWIWLGVAVAFHPLAGGWAGVTLLLAWLRWAWLEGIWRSPLAIWASVRGQLGWMAGGGLLALLGIGPALAMIGGPKREGEIVVAQIHAFYRLAHHQTPHLFWVSQHVAGAITLLLLGVATLALRCTRQAASPQISQQLLPLWRLTQVAWLAVGISAIGLAIDLVGVRVRPDITASLLRFYWFRWSDIVVPLTWVTVAWSLGAVWQSWPTQQSVVIQRAGVALTALCAVSLGSLFWQRVEHLLSTDVAPADQTLLMSESPTRAAGPEVVQEWLALCYWVRLNTPPDSLWLTPRAQQTFKWYAHRAEVATFKDVPQDAQSLLEWYDRIGRIAPPRDAQLEPLGWTDSQVRALHRRYRFHYLIVDRRIQREPLEFQLVYPEATGMQLIGGTFAVYKMPEPEIQAR